MRIKTKIMMLLCVLWMLFIFFWSGQSNKASSDASDNVTAVIVNAMYGDEKPKTPEDVGMNSSDEVVNELLDKGLVPKDDIFGRNKFGFKNDIRKLAHIFLYFVLAVLVNVTFITHFGRNKLVNVIISFFICVAYASLDELHQYFVPGRGAQLMDVGIDGIGVLLGIAVVMTVCAVAKLVKIIVSKSEKTA